MSSKYFFTQSWFQGNERTWDGMLSAHFNKDQKLRFLEIGSHEGRSTTFILDNFMNHPDSILHCIDPFLSDDPTSPVDNNTYEIFKRNISLSDNYSKLVLHKDKSQYILPLFLQARREYDVIYIDGSHLPKDIMSDAILCSELIAKNGMLIFDDYGSPTNEFEIKKTINNFNSMLNPKEWRIAGNWYQMFLQKSFNENRSDIWEIHY